MMVVDIATEPNFTAGSPEVLFAGRYSDDFGRDYDISPDGQRFLMVGYGQTDDPSAQTELIIVQNWFEELKQKVPVQ